MSTPVIKKTWSLVVLLTTGLVIFYLTIAVCVFSIFSSLLHPSHYHSEGIVTTKTGEVLIMHTEHSGNEYEQYYTDLDRNPVEVAATDISGEMHHLNSPEDDNEILSDLTRKRRIFGFLERGLKPRKWYFIVESAEQLTGHFEVYDPITQRRLFFVGNQGRMETRPTAPQLFQLPRTHLYHLHSVMFINETTELVSGENGGIPTPWGLSTKTGSLFDTYGLLRTRNNRVWQVNFLTGDVSPFLPELEVVDMKQAMLSRELRPEDWSRTDHTTEPALLFRTPDSLVWFGVHGEKTFQAKIPAALQEKDFSAQLLESNQVLYLTARFSEVKNESYLDLLWADTAGTTLDKREDVVTQRSNRRDLDENRWVVASVFPALIPYATMLATAPTVQLEQKEGITKAEARLRLIQLSADVLLTLLIFGILLAVWFYRSSRASNAPCSWTELAWIVLTGPFGYIILRYVTWQPCPTLQPIESRPGIDIIRLPQAG